MNLSAELTVLVPPKVVTVTSTMAAAWAGAVAVICPVPALKEKAAFVAPNCIVFTNVRLVPLIITDVPPLAGPEVGLIKVTVGWTESTNTPEVLPTALSVSAATPE